MKPHIAALALLSLTHTAQAQTPNLTGTTTNTKGEPLRKVALLLLPNNSAPSARPPARYSAESGDDGRFAFYGVPPGRYRLTGDLPGYGKATYGARYAWSEGAVIDIRADATVTGITLPMTEQGVISGTVVDDNGKPAAVTVYVYERTYRNGKPSWKTVSNTRSDASGAFTINKLGDGPYVLGASRQLPGITVVVTTFFPGVLDPNEATPLTVGPGRTLENMQLVLQTPQLVQLSGTLSPPPPPGKGVSVALTHVQGNGFPGGAVPVAPDGSFRTPAVPGTYFLTAETMEMPAGGLRPGAMPPMVGHAAATLNVSNDTSGITLNTEKSTLRGAIRWEGEPLPTKGIAVDLVSAIDLPWFSHTAELTAESGFTLSLLPLEYRVRLANLPPRAYLKAAAFDGKDVLETGFDLAKASPEAKLDLLLSTAAATLRGRVVSTAGNAVEATVVLAPEPPSRKRPELIRTAKAASDGSFAIESLPPGSYHLYAFDEIEPGAHLNPAFLEPYKALPVELAENDIKQITVTRTEPDSPR